MYTLVMFMRVSMTSSTKPSRDGERRETRMERRDGCVFELKKRERNGMDESREIEGRETKDEPNGPCNVRVSPTSGKKGEETYIWLLM